MLDYTNIEKKYLAIILSMKKFKNIVQRSYVEIFTDSINCVFDNQNTLLELQMWTYIERV